MEASKQKLEEIYLKALKFTNEKFPEAKPSERRITVLSIMKMLLELEKMAERTG